MRSRTMTLIHGPLLDDRTVAAYLRRIGAERPGAPTSAALRDLHHRHVMTVPFENVDFHLREPVSIGPAAVDKIVTRRRGGVCCELNGAFFELLRALGFRAEVLAGRVADDGAFGPIIGHMALRVHTADSPDPWLADVGYGRGARHPLRWTPGLPQRDPHGTFELARAPHGDTDLLRDGRLQYRLEDRPRLVADFEAMWWWLRHSPESPHRRHLYCTLPTPDGGRVTLSGNTLTVRANGDKSTVVIEDEDELRETYRARFGVELSDLPPVTSRPPATR
ncbi:arylamine N-acetyltransferase family protein [Nonomuraea candida]|uniref:arylamine N-acetyltransferase family protein n=1 Tax=Nonomuraea candida TaxID=359159 RepID=UPI001FE0A8A9|nr:arylamine N-acetyltransferase [Nonomuraea candida]